MNKYSSVLKRIEKRIIPDTKKLQDLKTLIESFREYDYILQSLKEDIKFKKSSEDLIENATAKSKILEPLNNFYNAFCEAQTSFVKNQTVKDLRDFFEKYRTYRTYQLNEKLLERFLSGFLHNFAEDFRFKTEFIGQVDLNKFAQSVNGIKENSTVKIKYNAIPKTIKQAYTQKLKKFIIESHNLKMVFKENYLIEIYSNRNMINKIDKVAKENNISFL